MSPPAGAQHAASSEPVYRAKAPLRVSFAGGGTDLPPFPEREGGLVLSVVAPWTFNMASFDGIRLDPASGQLTACADPRRAGAAEGG